MARKLVIDMDAFETCATKLESATKEMTSIQTNLAKAMEELLNNGWVGAGSTAFNTQFDASWVEGIADRVAVMERMCEQVNYAKSQYQPIVDAADKITISR